MSETQTANLREASASCRCEQGQAEVTQPIDHERFGFGPEGGSIRQPRSDMFRLAAFLLPNGGRIEFWGDPTEGEFGLMELSGIHSCPVLMREPNRSFLEQYTRLAPRGMPVPESLLQLEDPATHAELRRRFEFAELIEETIEISDDQFDLIGPSGTAAGSSSDCFYWNCSWGTQDFTNFACQGSYPNNAHIWCDAGMNLNFLDRWTGCGSKRKKSLGITAVCNTQIGYVKHHYRNCVTGKWFLANDWTLPMGHVCWTQYSGTIKRARWVKHGVLNTQAGAYFRAFTAIYN